MGFQSIGVFVFSCLFLSCFCALPKEFQVLEFALDGIEHNPLSFATLIDHKPSTPFPDVFTFCWRSRTAFARYMWSWNYVEIPLRPGERFMALYQKDNATHSHIGGKHSNFTLFFLMNFHIRWYLWRQLYSSCSLWCIHSKLW